MHVHVHVYAYIYIYTDVLSICPDSQVVTQ